MINFEEDWYLLANYNSTKEWILDSFALANFSPSLPLFESLGIKLNGHLKFGIKKHLDTTIKLDNTTPLAANTYRMSIFFEGNAISADGTTNTLLNMFGKLRADFSQIDFYLSSQSGLLGIYSPARAVNLYPVTPISIPGFPQSLDLFNMDGFEKCLIYLDAKKKN